MTRDLRARSVLAGEASAAAAELEAALATPPVSHAAAFFDVDNTLLQGASVYHLARGLYRRRFFTFGEIAGKAWQQLAFRLRGETPESVDKARSAALSFIAGHRVSEVKILVEEIFDELMADRIWPGTKALAQRHLDAGERVWLVTAAPVEVAHVLARRLGLTGALGTVAAQSDGVYTGVLVGDILHGPAKAEAVRALAAHEGLDLTACSAYSDSVNDLPMLEMVGNPWAINPDGRLRRHAEVAGWQVRDYRTGRKATRLALLTAGASGVTLGAVSAAVAIQRCLSRGCASRRRVS
ncbi:HAD family hydrolase [Kribbella sp. CA-253562]|uniref:HAD family hydrolase n=1 Tax=Kribbella sp. CA-253562 TaxID=3239942 RepID=UPI003D8CBA22